VLSRTVEVATAGLAEPSTSQGGRTGSTTGAEGRLAEVLADIMGVEQVSVDSNFFDELGADSMLMARFCARVRKRADLPSVSIKDIYSYPTIRSLATGLAAEALVEDSESAVSPAELTAESSAESSAESLPPTAPPASTLRYLLCGALQFLAFLGYCYLVALVADLGFGWISGAGLFDVYLRSVLVGGAGLLGMCIVPILVKWVLIGRWKPQEIRIWSLAYVRFWIVRTLVRLNPLVLSVGSPLYVFYLRALGAKVGRGVAVFSRNVPVCTDLLVIGAGTVIRKESFFLCYRAHSGLIQTGAVSLGRDAFVGEKSVLDINTSMGDDAQLGHSSALHSGQRVPDGEHWHGSPAQPTEVDYLRIARATRSRWRKVLFCILGLVKVFFLYVPLAEGAVDLLLRAVPALDTSLSARVTENTLWRLGLAALVLSVVLFVGAVLVGLLIVGVVPRALNVFLKPGKVYPLYGFHYRIHRLISRLTNKKFFTYLFGDSSYIVHYLRGLGYHLSQVEQTGSNFGLEVAHDNPYLSSVGTGTMVADGLSIINADFSSTSFAVSRTSIGPRNFLGNSIAYPSGGRTGDNCLLATKVMIPLDGEIREGVGLLGSPSFEIPRSVERDSRFDDLWTADELPRRLSAKNRYNVRTMGYYLFVRWLHVLLLTILGVAAIEVPGAFARLAIAAFFALSLVVSTVYVVLVERIMTASRALRPSYCSIYDPRFWWHERLWKVPEMAYVQAFNGTPFKGLIWRLMGAQVGRRLFDDGCYFTERTLVTIGNDCTLNAGSKVQCHSQEDGAFKSDRSTIGAGCTVGVGALVHYGVTMGDGAVLAADSFLMKGEEVPPHARWGGNPAREIRVRSAPAATMLLLPVRPTRRRTPAWTAAVLVGVVAADLAILTAGGRGAPVPARQSLPLPPTPAIVASQPAVAGSRQGSQTVAAGPGPSPRRAPQGERAVRVRAPESSAVPRVAPNTVVHRSVSRPAPEPTATQPTVAEPTATEPTTGSQSSGSDGATKKKQQKHKKHSKSSDSTGQ
jgi:non-ribosomal peptide synthetase-like protein